MTANDRIALVRMALAEAGLPESAAYVDTDGVARYDNRVISTRDAWKAANVTRASPRPVCFRCFEAAQPDDHDRAAKCEAWTWLLDDCGVDRGR